MLQKLDKNFALYDHNLNRYIYIIDSRYTAPIGHTGLVNFMISQSFSEVSQHRLACTISTFVHLFVCLLTQFLPANIITADQSHEYHVLLQLS